MKQQGVKRSFIILNHTHVKRCNSSKPLKSSSLISDNYRKDKKGID
jgi:hypothetical protein